MGIMKKKIETTVIGLHRVYGFTLQYLKNPSSPSALNPETLNLEP